MARPRLISDEDLYDKAIAQQREDPLMSEGAIMSALGFGKGLLSVRAQKSELLTEARDVMIAIRERAWIQKGLTGMSDKFFNATAYIWMTRNILGWRDQRQEDETPRNAPTSTLTNITITPELVSQMIKSARGEE